MSAATDGYGKIYLWTVAGGRLLATLAAENLHNASSSSAQNLDSLAFSPDSTAPACGTATGIVRVRDAATAVVCAECRLTRRIRSARHWESRRPSLRCAEQGDLRYWRG